MATALALLLVSALSSTAQADRPAATKPKLPGTLGTYPLSRSEPTRGGTPLEALAPALDGRIAGLRRASALQLRTGERLAAVGSPKKRAAMERFGAAYDLNLAVERHVETRLASLGREVMRRGQLRGDEPLPVLTAWTELAKARGQLSSSRTQEGRMASARRSARASGDRWLGGVRRAQLRGAQIDRHNAERWERAAARELGNAFIAAYGVGSKPQSARGGARAR